MKKSIVIFVALALVVSLLSCKKDYNCVCNVNNFGQTVNTSYDIKAKNKSDAQSQCDTHAANGGSQSVTCTIQ